MRGRKANQVGADESPVIRPTRWPRVSARVHADAACTTGDTTYRLAVIGMHEALLDEHLPILFPTACNFLIQLLLLVGLLSARGNEVP